MKKGMLIFTNGKLSSFDEGITDAIFTSGKLYAYDQTLMEIFSDETCNKISLVKKGGREKFKVALRSGVMLDALVCKFEIDSESELVTVKFPQLPVNLELSEEQTKATHFNFLANVHLKNVFAALSELETKSNSKKIIYIKEQLFLAINAFMHLFKFVKSNNIKNSSLNLVCINVWSLIRELEEILNSITNVEIVNKYYSCYNAFINVGNVKNIISDIVRHISVKGHRVYIKSKYDDFCARIIISDFKDEKNKEESVLISEIDEIGFICEKNTELMGTGADLESKYYKDGSVEYALVFVKNERAKVCED